MDKNVNAGKVLAEIEETLRHGKWRLAGGANGQSSLWRPKSKTGFLVLDSVSKAEIAFSACATEKSMDGTFSTSC